MSLARPPATTAWVNCAAGVAGDMLLSALVDAGADRLAIMDAWAALGIGGFAATFERVDRAGVAATWLNMCIDEHAGHDHTGHEHVAHDHTGHQARGHEHGGHHHRPAREVIDLIGSSGLGEGIRDNAIRVYRSLAAVEAAIHGADVDEIDLHEVGSTDSILDIVGVCAALDDLAIDELTYSPIGIGHGIATIAHGDVPHPAPATARLIEAAQADIVGVATALETATPTGVALITALGAGVAAPPPMSVSAVGFGAGTANPPGRANVVQVMLGSRLMLHDDPNATDITGTEIVHEVSTNVDDATPEVVAYTIERLMAVGALDAWASPISMKKSRPGTLISCLASPDLVGAVRDVLLVETGSLGARVRPVGRWPVERTTEVVVIDGHKVSVKIIAGRRKAEYADAAAAAQATGRPLRSIIAEAERRSHTTSEAKLD